MPRAEVLFQIKDAEAQVRKMKKEAEEEKVREIYRAKQEASEILENGEKEIEKEASKKIEAVREEVGKERKMILEKEIFETEKLKQNASKKIDSAVHYLLTQFEVEVLRQK
ncbi:MAG: V-type ATP synthase subunit H [Thermoplasmata archaeon]